MRYVLTLVAAVCAACVTSGDLREVAYALERVELVAADQDASVEDVKAEIEAQADVIGAIADNVESRTEGLLGSLSGGQQGGIVSVLAMLGLHLYRNSTRKKDLEKVNGSSTA